MLLLDEWSSVPRDLRPFLADLLRRAVLPVRGLTVKIAAIERRSRFAASTVVMGDRGPARRAAAAPAAAGYGGPAPPWRAGFAIDYGCYVLLLLDDARLQARGKGDWLNSPSGIPPEGFKFARAAIDLSAL